jgi:hypothetical protein
MLEFNPLEVVTENRQGVVPNVTGHELSLMRRGIHQNPLDEIVTVLITCYYKKNQYLLMVLKPR